MEPQRYKKTKILLLLLLISFLLHLIMSFFFLEFGFRKRFTSFITTLSNSINSLSPKDKQIIKQQREIKHEALQKIFETARKNKKPIKQPDIFTKSNTNIKPKPDNNVSAKLVAPKSEFGWVIFDDNYEKPKKFKMPKTKDGDLIKSEESDVSEIHPENFNSPKDISSNIVVPELKAEPRHEKKPNINLSTKHTKQEIKIAKAKQVTIQKNSIVEKNIKSKSVNKDKSIDELKKITGTAIIDETKKIDNVAVPTALTQKKELCHAEEPEQDSPAPEENIRKVAFKLDKEQERKAILQAILKNKNSHSDKDRPVHKASKGSKFIWGLNNPETEKSEKIGSLPKGYIYKPFGEDGTDLIDKCGDPNKEPSPKEMEYNVYEAKIKLCLNSTWAYNSDYFKLPHEPGIYPIVIMEAEINSSGHLISSKILKSSGIEDVDKAAMRTLRFASPFPPLPKAFNTKVYKKTLPFQYLVL
ncbi:MAG: energy transducer TonB [bacterium]